MELLRAHYKMKYMICVASIQSAKEAFSSNTNKISKAVVITTEHCNKECIICLDVFALDNHASCLPCGHTFHSQCIQLWFGHNPEHNCPICRAPEIRLAPFAGVHVSNLSVERTPRLSLFGCILSTDCLATNQHLNVPNVKIDERERDHFTQILYILKRSFHNKQDFLGWQPFTKEYLVRICKADEHIYLENWENGATFVEAFPQKIDEFLSLYCICVGV